MARKILQRDLLKHILPQNQQAMYFQLVLIQIAIPELRNLDFVVLQQNRYVEGEGTAFDLHYFHIDDWTEELQSQADVIRNELGYFKNPEFKLMKPTGNVR